MGVDGWIKNNASAASAVLRLSVERIIAEKIAIFSAKEDGSCRWGVFRAKKGVAFSPLKTKDKETIQPRRI